MMLTENEILKNEYNVSEAFSRQSAVFDDVYDNNPITAWMREQVRSEMLRFLPSQSRILELNCGTGTDAIFLAKRGHSVMAIDNAPGMLEQLRMKVKDAGLDGKIEAARCSFEQLDKLQVRMYDYVFSNFSGLNCTDDLPCVLRQVDKLLKPGGHFTLVIMPKVCPWELLQLVKGRRSVAMRRFRKEGAAAHIEGIHFTCWYYSPSAVTKAMTGYTLCSLKGLASLVPPPSLAYFPVKYRRLYSWLKKAEQAVSRWFPFNRWCDQYAITMRKNAS